MKMLTLFLAMVSLSSFTAFWASEEYKRPPVELSYFDATALDDKVILEWKTISEQYASHAEIERSNDKINFEKIETVAFDAPDDKGKVYKFSDKNPFSEYNFYRLKMIDKDGKFDYSKVVSVFVEPIREITDSKNTKSKETVKP